MKDLHLWISIVTRKSLHSFSKMLILPLYTKIELLNIYKNSLKSKQDYFKENILRKMYLPHLNYRNRIIHGTCSLLLLSHITNGYKRPKKTGENTSCSFKRKNIKGLIFLYLQRIVYATHYYRLDRIECLT